MYADKLCRKLASKGNFKVLSLAKDQKEEEQQKSMSIKDNVQNIKDFESLATGIYQ